MKKKFSKELIIGFTVLLSLLILFFGINYLKGINVFKAANYYYVSYNNVTGLTISTPVTANGFKVGFVREMQYEYDNPGHILVELSLDKELKVPQGTKALLTSDMLGTATIKLDMPLGSNNYHAIGDKIIGEVPAGLMDNVTNEILPSVSSLSTKVDSLLTSLTTIVSNPALHSSLNRLDKITANLEESTTQLAKAMNSMPKVMTNASNVTDNLTSISQNLNELSAELNKIPLDSTMQNIYVISQNINNMTSKLNSKNSSLGLLLNDSSLYNNLENATGSLDSLLIDIKKNPKRYISIKLL